MHVQRGTRYALCAALELAAAGPGQLVTASEVAAKYTLPPTVVAKILQRLAQAGVVIGARGTTGGYRLARPAGGISVLEIVELFEGPRQAENCALGECDETACARTADCRLRDLFAEVDEQARATFASVSLATLVAPRGALATG
jgi:Rrf2 family protein